MRFEGVRVLVMIGGLLASGAALASIWDWDVEFTSRHWRSATLAWAQDTHPAHPSLSWIQNNNPAPPHEMWCHYSESPASADCTTFHTKLNTWLQGFLDTQNVPQGAFDTFPKECASICIP
jgi:hypothetical protein